MRTHQHRVVEYVGKPFADRDYDDLLSEFEIDHAERLEEWRTIERKLFENRRGQCAYPDQHLMKFCQEYLRRKLVDQRGGYGAFRAWRVLRGRILRSLLHEEPSLHPAPGKVLITEPRTCTDSELDAVVQGFGREHPALWTHWARVEAAFGDFGDDPLRDVSLAFHRYLRDHCWVLCGEAISHAFSDVREMYFWGVGQKEARQ